MEEKGGNNTLEVKNYASDWRAGILPCTSNRFSIYFSRPLVCEQEKKSI